MCKLCKRPVEDIYDITKYWYSTGISDFRITRIEKNAYYYKWKFADRGIKSSPLKSLKSLRIIKDSSGNLQLEQTIPSGKKLYFTVTGNV
jgi:hypothetical protein